MATPSSGNINRQFDSDTQETAEWVDALQALIAAAGPERARFPVVEIDRLHRGGHDSTQASVSQLRKPLSTTV